MSSTILEEKARKTLLANYKATGERYICPAWPHYPHQWFWDSCFHAISAAHLGLHDFAKNEIVRLLSFEDERGFIPSYIYAHKFQWWNWRDWFAWERFAFKGFPDTKVPIVGVPVLAQAVRALGDSEFFQAHAEKIVAFYKYFPAYRDPDHDGLISIITPREGGRDSSPEYDFFRGGRLPRVFSFLAPPLDQIFLAIMEARYKMMGWNEKKILASNIFNVQDLVVQCIYIDGLYDLAWMMKEWGGGYTQYPDIAEVTAKAEQAVITKCWSAKDKAFTSMRNGTTHLGDLTIAALFPLLIKNLPQSKRDTLIGMLSDISKFGASYPVPSVAILHQEFNPSGTLLLWRGPTWVNMNWFLIRGLLRHGRRDIAEYIVRRTIRMVERHGFREFYNPRTGKGLRVHNFGWSTLAVTFEKLINSPQNYHS